LNSNINKDKLDKCNKTINKKITSALWNNCFPQNFKEIEYEKTPYCTFDCVIDIIEKKTNEKLEINRIKNTLYNEYKKYLSEYSEKIIDILIIEGKRNLCDQVKGGLLSFENLIYSDNYFLTTLDIWLLVDKYKIPTMFISSKNLLQTNYEKNIFLGYGDTGDKFCFCVIPGFSAENIPSYKIIQSNEDEIFISVDQIKNNECVDKINNTILGKKSIEEYLKKFEKNTVNKKKQIIKQKIIIEEDNIQPTEDVVIRDKDEVPINTETIVKEKPKTKKTKTAKGGAAKTHNNKKTKKLY
jgi:hypothetical protein